MYRVQYPIYCIFMLSCVGAFSGDLIDGVSNSCGQTGTIANTKSLSICLSCGYGKKISFDGSVRDRTVPWW